MSEVELRTMFWDMISVHIEAIPVSSAITLHFEELENPDILGYCLAEEDPETLITEWASIYINENVLDEPTDIQKDVICHEFAHLICGSDDDSVDGHTKLWEDVCLAIGGTLDFY